MDKVLECLWQYAKSDDVYEYEYDEYEYEYDEPIHDRRKLDEYLF